MRTLGPLTTSEGCSLLAQVVEHVAGYLGLDATMVRERNFMRPKDLPAHPYAPPNPLKPSSSAQKPSSKTDDQNCNGKAQHLESHSQSHGGSGTVSGADEETGQTERLLSGTSGQKKRDTTPDVVCGRFQFKEPNGDSGNAAAVSEGRCVT